MTGDKAAPEMEEVRAIFPENPDAFRNRYRNEEAVPIERFSQFARLGLQIGE